MASAASDAAYLQMPAICVIGGACPFRRDHGRAERGLRRARPAELRAVVRLLESLEDQAADAEGRFLRLDVVHREPRLGVEVAIRLAEPVAAPRDQADPA